MMHELLSWLILLCGFALTPLVVVRFKWPAFVPIALCALALGLWAGVPLPDLREGVGRVMASAALVVGLGAAFGFMVQHGPSGRRLASALAEFDSDSPPLLFLISCFMGVGLLFAVVLSVGEGALARDPRLRMRQVLALANGASAGNVASPLMYHVMIICPLLQVDPWRLLAASAFPSLLGAAVAMLACHLGMRNVRDAELGTTVRSLPSAGGSWAAQPEAPRVGSLLPSLLVISAPLICIALSMLPGMPSSLSSSEMALAVGILVAWLHARGKVSIDASVPASVGAVLLVMAAGGLLQAAMQGSGLIDSLISFASGLGQASWVWPVLAYGIAFAVRLMIGSSGVAAMAAAAALAHGMPPLSDFQLTLVAASACFGGVAFSNFTDGGFWNLCRLVGAEPSALLKTWTIAQGLASWVAFLVIMLFWCFS